MQKRWSAGIVFTTGFLSGFVWLMLIAGKIIIGFYRMGFDPGYEPDAPNAMAMLPPAAIAILFYLINLFDVFFAQQRIARAQREQRFIDESLSMKTKAGEPTTTTG